MQIKVQIQSKGGAVSIHENGYKSNVHLTTELYEEKCGHHVEGSSVPPRKPNADRRTESWWKNLKKQISSAGTDDKYCKRDMGYSIDGKQIRVLKPKWLDTNKSDESLVLRARACRLTFALQSFVVHSNTLRTYRRLVKFRGDKCNTQLGADGQEPCGTDIEMDTNKHKKCKAASELYVSSDRCGSNFCNVKIKCTEPTYQQCKLGYKVDGKMEPHRDYKYNKWAQSLCQEFYSVQTAYENEQMLLKWLEKSMGTHDSKCASKQDAARVHHFKQTSVRALALDKPTMQSSTDGGASSSAVDGNFATSWNSGSCTRTKVEPAPWWRLDLQKSYQIDAVTVVNSEHSLSNFEVKVGETDAGKTWGTANSKCGGKHSIDLQATLTIKCGLHGRYIFIGVPKQNTSLVLCEVEVFGEFIGPCGSGFKETAGDIGGWGKVNGRGGGETVTECNKCAELCSSDTVCKSYECSPSEKRCNLNHVATATSGPYKDYNFCVKDLSEPCSATFIDNVGNQSPNKTPLKIDDNTFVFGHASDWYKMVAVDAQGHKIENRYMDKNLALTKANWENAHRGGSYSASYVQMCSKASSTGGFSNN
jgi:hypothetical protein